MGSYQVKEQGKNGSVEILPDRIVRTIKKTLGRNDTQTIPIKSIHEVKIDRRMGRSIVKVTTSAATYEWKCGNAQGLHDEIEAQLFA